MPRRNHAGGKWGPGGRSGLNGAVAEFAKDIVRPDAWTLVQVASGAFFGPRRTWVLTTPRLNHLYTDEIPASLPPRYPVIFVLQEHRKDMFHVWDLDDTTARAHRDRYDDLPEPAFKTRGKRSALEHLRRWWCYVGTRLSNGESTFKRLG